MNKNTSFLKTQKKQTSLQNLQNLKRTQSNISLLSPKKDENIKYSSFITKINLKKRKIPVFIKIEIEVLEENSEKIFKKNEKINFKEKQNFEKKKFDLKKEKNNFYGNNENRGILFIPKTVCILNKNKNKEKILDFNFDVKKSFCEEKEKEIFFNNFQSSIFENSKKLQNHWKKITKNFFNVFSKKKFSKIKNVVVITDSYNLSDKIIPDKTPFK